MCGIAKPLYVMYRTIEAENTSVGNDWEKVGFKVIQKNNAQWSWDKMGYTSVACRRARNAMQCSAKLLDTAGSRAGILYYSIHQASASTDTTHGRERSWGDIRWQIIIETAGALMYLTCQSGGFMLVFNQYISVDWVQLLNVPNNVFEGRVCKVFVLRLISGKIAPDFLKTRLGVI